jgi:hypothetical protein
VRSATRSQPRRPEALRLVCDTAARRKVPQSFAALRPWALALNESSRSLTPGREDAESQGGLIGGFTSVNWLFSRAVREGSEANLKASCADCVSSGAEGFTNRLNTSGSLKFSVKTRW